MHYPHIQFRLKPFSFLKRKYILIPLVIVIVIIAGIYLLGPKKSQQNTFTVSRGEVISEVSVTGKVKPAQILNLAFEKSGRIKSLKVKVGDKVEEGGILVTLDNGDLYAQLAQAQATVKEKEAKLEELKKGTRIEDIRVKEAELQKAKQDLANYYDSVINVLNDAYIKADDAIRKQLDALFLNDDTASPRLTFVSKDIQAVIDSEWQRFVVGDQLNAWRSEIEILKNNASPADLDGAIPKDRERLAADLSFLNRLLDAVEGTSGMSADTIATYKVNIGTGRTEITTAATSVADQEQAISAQKAVVERIQNELNLELAGSTPEQIAAQEAQVEQAKANVNYYYSQIAKTILIALFAGTVTKTNFEVGDIVLANSPVVSLIGKGKFQIEADIPESDIAKVKVGEEARVTLDAYGPDLVFEAKVAQIDLSATVLEGIPTYKTTLQFLGDDERILPGLTANVDILSTKKENVLYVPTRNIIDKNNNKFVKVLRGKDRNTVEEIEVTAGLRGSDGRTEIISGLFEGDLVVVE